MSINVRVMMTVKTTMIALTVVVVKTVGKTVVVVRYDTT